MRKGMRFVGLARSSVVLGVGIAVILTAALSCNSAFAKLWVHFESEDEWAGAIGSQIQPLPVQAPAGGVGWDLVGSAFPEIGSGDFVESRLWASGGGEYGLEGQQPVGTLPPGMGMEWPKTVDPPEGNYIGGWAFSYETDPNLSGATLLLDVNPPNVGAAGFAINTVGIGLVDVNGLTRSWTYNVVAGPPGNGVLLSNMMNWVKIGVKPGIFGGAAGDASHGLAPPPGPFPWDLAAFADTGYDPTKTMWIVGIENGRVPVGGAANAPRPGGNYVRSPFNWWGVLAVQPPIPEPATIAIWGLLGLCWAAFRVRQRRRKVALLDPAVAGPQVRRSWPEQNRVAIHEMLDRHLVK